MGQVDTKLAEANALKKVISKASLIDVKEMITKGVDVDGWDDDGNTPLQNAITTGDLRIVEYLITSKANVCKRGKNEITPLVLAVQKGNLNVINLLLRNGADATIQSALSEAIILKNVEIVRLLIHHHALFLNVHYNDGHTPLTKAVEVENLDIIKILIENKANVNMPKADGTTPLTLALQIGNINIAKYLIAKKANFQEKDSDLLLKYIGTKNFEMVRLLIELGVNVNSFYKDIDTTMDTPLLKAIKVENFEIAEYLVEKGAYVDQPGINGKVPLAVAASLRDIRIVKLLIRSNARLDLAKEELVEYATLDNDVAVSLQILKKTTGVGIRKQSFEDGGHEAAK